MYMDEFRIAFKGRSAGIAVDIKLSSYLNSYLKKRVYSVHIDTGRKRTRCRCRIRCCGQKQGNSFGTLQFHLLCMLYLLIFAWALQ